MRRFHVSIYVPKLYEGTMYNSTIAAKEIRASTAANAVLSFAASELQGACVFLPLRIEGVEKWSAEIRGYGQRAWVKELHPVNL